jgi:hypothetical protein
MNLGLPTRNSDEPGKSPPPATIAAASMTDPAAPAIERFGRPKTSNIRCGLRTRARICIRLAISAQRD